MSATSPPPCIDLFPLIEFAVVEGCSFSGSTGLFVDGLELGAVPFIAICGPDQQGTVLLAHCDDQWHALGVSAHRDQADARQRAERIYAGLSSRWLPSPFSPADIQKHLQGVFADAICDVCKRDPTHVASLVTSSDGVSICDQCLAKSAPTNTP